MSVICLLTYLDFSVIYSEIFYVLVLRKPFRAFAFGWHFYRQDKQIGLERATVPKTSLDVQEITSSSTV